MSEVKNTISVRVPIAEVLLHGEQAAGSKALNAEFKKQGVADGLPVQVDVVPHKYDYEFIATW